MDKYWLLLGRGPFFGRCWIYLAGGGLLWLVVDGGVWWSTYFGWWWVEVDGGGWWHSLV